MFRQSNNTTIDPETNEYNNERTTHRSSERWECKQENNITSLFKKTTSQSYASDKSTTL